MPQLCIRVATTKDQPCRSEPEWMWQVYGNMKSPNTRHENDVTCFGPDTLHENEHRTDFVQTRSPMFELPQESYSYYLTASQ
ncbi:hypothetical protein PISMIDRAFT_672570 [Pisolithus microcarpus 441]|uniref:Uncharacterized protein n=1 Tax=Pisolithus microcarpus 441 TaxID=765257 RepID=A0A0D0A446_9AGAM|nr:hypothetical protein PISMIDRAFT_672570 [Pisolithus microcarpus 441]